MDAIRNVQIDIAIDSAGEVVVAGARRLFWIPLVVDANGNDIFSRMELVGDIEGKSGVTAQMGPCGLTVDKDFCFNEGAFKFDAHTLSVFQPLRGNIEGLAV